MSIAADKWIEHRLGDLATYINGRAFKPSEWGKTGRPIIRIQNLTDPVADTNYFDGDVDDRHVVRNGDLLISWSATLGAYIWTRDEAVLNQHIFKVAVRRDRVDKDFLYYLVLHSLRHMGDQTHGSTMRHITKSRFESLAVHAPSVPEQRRIVGRIKEMMSRVDEAIGLRIEALKESIAVFPSVLASRFDDFANSAPVVTVESVIVESRYGTSQKCDRNESGTPVIRIPNVVDGAVNLEDLKYRHFANGDLAMLKLVDGDLLVVRTNGSKDLVGRCAIYRKQPREFAFASYLIRLRPDKKKVDPQFLGYFLESTCGRDAIAAIRKTSAGQYNINSENLRAIQFPCPSLPEQQEAVEQMAEQRALTRQLRAHIEERQLEEQPLRDAILRKAFAGEL